MPRLGVCVIALALLATTCAVGESVGVDGESVSGCPCTGPCQRSIDSPFQAWCPVAGANKTTGCVAYYSSRRGVKYDLCDTGNSTNTTNAQGLTTFSAMWWRMTFTCTGTVAAVYASAGLLGAARSAVKAAVWLPAAAGAFGALLGVFLGGVASALIAVVYLSIPYAIDGSVAIELGVALAVLILWASLARGQGGWSPPHAVEYGPHD